MKTPAASGRDTKTRVFAACVAVLLLSVTVYAGLVLAAWTKTPLGQCPQGEAAAWLSWAESFHDGTMLHEPFFRAPIYMLVLAALRLAGVSAASLPFAAGVLNILAHLGTTALVIVLGYRFWRRKGALVAGAIWGFYPPAVFLAVQPLPETLALLAWAGGVAAALGTVWQSPFWQGGRLSRRHAWAYPFTAGIAFAFAACLTANMWPIALAWPIIVIFLGRDLRPNRLFAAAFGVGLVGLVMVGFQDLWGGSPQPLAGADLYRLAQAMEITQPWIVPLPVIEFSDNPAPSDHLELEARISYQAQTNLPAPGHAVLSGYWWRTAVKAALSSPAHSVLRAVRKTNHLFAAPDYSTGADFARAKAELPWLKFNPLNWGILLVMGLAGLALGWRSPAASLAVVLVGLALLGGVIEYPTMEARAPAAVMLALLAGGLVATVGKKSRNDWLLFGTTGLFAAVLAWWPRNNSPESALTSQDSRERAIACAKLGRYDEALDELSHPVHDFPPSFLEREMAAGWRFKQLLSQLPVRPANNLLEEQLLDNNDLMRQSPSAQFRCGACLWLLGRWEGALYYWENLADDKGAWGAAARMALHDSGRETTTDIQRRTAWEIGGSPRPDPSLASFFALLRAEGPPAVSSKN